MTAALSWLNDLMTWLGRWVPRPILVRATHVAVRFGPRGDMRQLVPGLHIYWPIAHEVELVSTRQRTLVTSGQIHEMSVVALVITYCVRDAVRLLRTFSDLHANLDQRAQATLSLAYANHLSNAALAGAVKASMTAEFADTGVDVLDVGIAQRSFCLPIKQMQDWSHHEVKAL